MSYPKERPTVHVRLERHIISTYGSMSILGRYSILLCMCNILSILLLQAKGTATCLEINSTVMPRFQGFIYGRGSVLEGSVH